MKALVIDEPWISAILRGEKTWEMRAQAIHHWGRVALIRKGSALVVGTADVTGCLPAIADIKAFAATEAFHRIPLPQQERTIAKGWTRPWVLANARPLPQPVPYQHKPGAMSRFSLEDDIAAVVAAQSGTTGTPSSRPEKPAANPSLTATKASPIPMTTPPALPHQIETRIVVLTDGNLGNNHIYIPLDFFPDDAIGGSTKADTSPNLLTVTFQPGRTVQTDIPAGRRFLRERAAFGELFVHAGLAAGDSVLITRTAPYAYTISKA